MDFAFFPVEFDKNASPVDPSQADALFAAVGAYAHVFVVSHGWNNDKADAQALYEALFDRISALLQSPGADAIVPAARVAVAGVFWPSKKFTDSDLIPGGAAAIGANEEDAARTALDALAADPRTLGDASTDPARIDLVEQAKSLVPRLESDPAARRQFVALLRSMQPRTAAAPEDGTDALFDRDADLLLSGLVAPVLAPPPTYGGSPAAALGLGSILDSVIGGVRDLGNGFVAAGRRLANLFTYYQMKDRAGAVGTRGLGPLLNSLRQAAGPACIHLVGHSFGARLVTAAADTLPPGTSGVSLTLLQGAYSHNGLAARFDGEHDGFFRHVVSDRKIAGPIAITHTKNDLAVGVAYPLASRIANQVAAALGDANDPYGGMGRNGAQRMSPGEVNAKASTLLPLGQAYAMRPGLIHNLNADAFIMGHSDIAKAEVAHALLAVAASTPGCGQGDASPAAAFNAGFAAPGGSAAGRADRAGGPANFSQTDFAVGSGAIPPHLNDPEYRKRWDLPANETTPGPYLIELNILHEGGLPEALRRFHELWKELVMNRGTREAPIVVSKTYVRCSLSVEDWRRIADADGREVPKRRAVYKIWPDFPVRVHVDRSIATVKADAAYRAYSASGEGVTWAVIDSGVYADHPHFGGATKGPHHVLQSDELASLHRCFVAVPDPAAAPGSPAAPIPDPDSDPALTQPQREALVRRHREAALQDPLGHGTHVAGIIAGGLSPDALAAPHGTASPATSPPSLRVFEQTFQSNGESDVIQTRYAERTVTDVTRLRGVAPRCKLISLRVMDADGRGRSSDVIRALEYVRERLNGDPKLLRVHGINLSVGYEFDAELFACGQSPLCVEVNRLVRSGVVVVTAAGNTGYGNVAAQARLTARVGLSNTINDPGNADMAITVGATHRDAPFTYGVSYFSSKGPTGDGRSKPDLVAPGERITSCAAGRNLQNLSIGLPIPPAATDAVYFDESGTSMAAPHVSGAIAAFLSIRREFIGRPWDVKQIFLNSATSLGRERYFEGHGLLDLMRAIQSV